MASCTSTRRCRRARSCPSAGSPSAIRPGSSRPASTSRSGPSSSRWTSPAPSTAPAAMPPPPSGCRGRPPGTARTSTTGRCDHPPGPQQRAGQARSTTRMRHPGWAPAWDDCRGWRHTPAPPRRNVMRTGSGQAGDPPAATQQAEPATEPPAASRLVTWHGDLLTRVDQLDWLRGLNDWLTAVLSPVRERHQDNLALELLHGGRWVGHPLHPALSDLPIGLWTGAAVLDVTDRGPAPRHGLDAAGMLSAAGILAACVTALTGLSDWTVSNEQDRRVGLFHGLLNTAALGLQGASLGSRMTAHRGTARALGAASLTVTAAAGYLGGHLVFTKGVMVNRVGWAIGPRRWVRALPEADLPDDSPTAIEAEGRQI